MPALCVPADCDGAVCSSVEPICAAVSCPVVVLHGRDDRIRPIETARQLKAVFDRIGLTRAMFEAEPYTRLKELKHLRDTDQVDPELHWNAIDPV